MNKLVEESLIDRIIRERLVINKANLEYCAWHEIINGLLLQSIREAMQAYHEAANKQIINEDIHKYIDHTKREDGTPGMDEQAFYEGAKAFRDGEIKHIEK
jgi:hypothetical protein